NQRRTQTARCACIVQSLVFAHPGAPQFTLFPENSGATTVSSMTFAELHVTSMLPRNRRWRAVEHWTLTTAALVHHPPEANSRIIRSLYSSHRSRCTIICLPPRESTTV
ncbi:unnamed protein product, partial [Ectocarpus sp. 8 AP-2014]